MSSMEEMAIAVLKGDMVAARALADLIVNEYPVSAFEVLPAIRKITCNVDKLRVLLFVKKGYELPDPEEFAEIVRQWIVGERQSLTLNGIQRVELYELP